MAHDVFVSYASHDKPVADAVCAALENRGVRCWIAPRDILPGLDWGAAIIGAINECRLMVLVFSSNANKSHQIRREVERAVSKGLTVIPLRIENVPPGKTLEYFISTPHWLDAITPPIEQHLDHISETVQLLLTRGTRDSTEIPVIPPRSGPRAATAAAAALMPAPFEGPAVAEPRRRRPLLWIAAAAAALALVGFFSLRGSPPEIVGLTFPDAITAGTRGASGSIQFRDPGADVLSAEFEVVEASEFQPFRVGAPVKGQKIGSIPFRVASGVPQKVTLQARLVDADGRRSEPFLFTFEVRNPAPTRRRPTWTIDTPRFRIGVP
ncbi:MAG: toll/interleukin-1 receptor domain-containing protein [Thermoanaerobaculia bacterium]